MEIPGIEGITAILKAKLVLIVDPQVIKRPATRRRKRRTNSKVNALKTKDERRKYVDVQINGQKVTLLLDSGSDISINDESRWIKMGRPKLVNTSKMAKSVCGKKLVFKGELNCTVKFGDQSFTTKV